MNILLVFLGSFLSALAIILVVFRVTKRIYNTRQKKQPSPPPVIVLEPWAKETLDVLTAELTLKTSRTPPGIKRITLKDKKTVRSEIQKRREWDLEQKAISPRLAELRNEFFSLTPKEIAFAEKAFAITAVKGSSK